MIIIIIDDEEEDDSGKVQEAESLLASLKENLDQNSGRLEDGLLIRLYRDKLKSKSGDKQRMHLGWLPKDVRPGKGAVRRARGRRRSFGHGRPVDSARTRHRFCRH